MKKPLLTLVLLAAAASVHAAEHEVKMLDIGADKAPMVFEPAVLKIAPGDTVTFVPTNKGHNVESKLVPDGAEAFKSELDEKYSVKLDKEGVYIYVCPPHSMMNMVGVIQVGEATNMEAVNSRVPKLEKRAMSNKGRLTKYIEQLKGDSADKPAAATATENQPAAATTTESQPASGDNKAAAK
nr:pseudoazurin [uncultured Cardiobacterium sp.]